jgi:flavin-dependent dehydrogenase
MTKHDVVVIGGSLAGSACVRELNRRGIDAIALERDRFPKRKVCGGFLSAGAVESIAHLGLLDEVLKAGAVEVKSARVRASRADVEIPFERPGLGISRTALDTIVARAARVREGWNVREVGRTNRAFHVDGIECRIVVDASGKLGRFTKRESVEEFGIQYVEPNARGSVLDFWFFDDGYGGAVSVEDGGSNFCFLIEKEALPKYLNRPNCLVTGPLAYDRLPGDFIAIGDAAGMVDPFCGEGMRHALESGILAARIIAQGIHRSASYAEIKYHYESAWERRWAFKRVVGTGLRRLRKRFGVGLKLAPSWLLNRMWD